MNFTPSLPEAITARPPLSAFLWDFAGFRHMAARDAHALRLHADKVKSMEASHALLLAFAEEMRAILPTVRMDALGGTSATYRLIDKAVAASEAGRASEAVAKAVA